MVGNIRRCRKHVRAIDLSRLSQSRPRRSPRNLLYLLRLLFLLADAGCIRGCRLRRRRHRERSARGEKYVESESSSERPRVDGRGEVRDAKGVGEGGYSTRYLNLRLPRGACTEVQSNRRLPASTRLELCGLSLLYTPSGKGVTYRDTSESTEGLDISRRSVLFVAAWFRARFTARERTTYGIPVEVRCGSLSLPSASLSFAPARFCIRLFTSQPIPNDLFFLSYKGKQISRRRGFTARGIRTTLVRLRALLPVTRRIPSLFPLLSAESRACRYFSWSRLKVRDERERGRERDAATHGVGISEKTRTSGRHSYYFAVPRLPLTWNIHSLWKLSFPPANSRPVAIRISRRVILRFYTRIISRYAAPTSSPHVCWNFWVVHVDVVFRLFCGFVRYMNSRIFTIPLAYRLDLKFLHWSVNMKISMLIL